MSVAEIDVGAGDPSGKSAGTSTALCLAKTPEPGSPAASASDFPRKRAIERSRCLFLAAGLVLCARTIAPSAAVISRAETTSKAQTY